MLRQLAENDCRIFLTRHGQTIFNAHHKAQGWCDAPLTENGIASAERLGRVFKAAGIQFQSVWASELPRQRHTAEIICREMGAELPVRTNNDLKEICFGRWEGEDEGLRNAAFAKHLNLPEGMHIYDTGTRGLCKCYVETDDTGMAEDFETLCTRISRGLMTIAQTAAAEGGGNVLAVSSGAISMVYYYDVCGFTKADAPNGIANSSFTIINYKDGKLSIELPLGRTEL